jgi:hypothetical protein
MFVVGGHEVKMEQPIVFSISVLLRQEGYGWAAQCLEYDIAAQGATIAEAKAAIEKVFVGQVVVDLSHGVAPLSGIASAPIEYWQQFKEAERLADQRQPLYIPPPYTVRATMEETRIAA